MPDQVSRKRLRKKVLDRWENEGGRICVDGRADALESIAGEDKIELTGESPRQDAAAKKEDSLGT